MDAKTMNIMTQSSFWDQHGKRMLCGAVAGAVSRTATSPLERLKILQQMDGAGAGWGSRKYTGNPVSVLHQIFKEEGIRGWYKGNGVNVIRIVPHSAVQFMAFDLYKNLLGEGSNSGKAQRDWKMTILAGGMTGMTSSSLVYPLDFVRSLLSVQGGLSKPKYAGIVDCITKVVKSDGVLGLYKGLNATLFGVTPYIAINFTTFDFLKSKYLPNRNDPLFDVWNLGLGAIAGGTAATLTYPTDVIRRRMQCCGLDASFPVYKNSLDCVKQVVASEGAAGLYKGMVACWAKVMPSMAIAFMTFERCKVVLEF